jgi:hypothetical protein
MVDRFADRMPQDVASRLRKFHSVGETLELASELAAVLVKRTIPVTVEDREALREFLYSFSAEYALANYSEIANRDEVLASLNVLDDPTA